MIVMFNVDTAACWKGLAEFCSYIAAKSLLLETAIWTRHVYPSKNVASASLLSAHYYLDYTRRNLNGRTIQAHSAMYGKL